MGSNDIIVFLILVTLLLLIIGLSIIFLFVAYRDRYNRHITEKEKLQSDSENRLLIAKIEAQEITMDNLSMELHDNISQLLYLAQTNIKVITREAANTLNHRLITDTGEILHTVVEDIQNLGRSLNGELMKGIGLVAALKNETARLEGRGLITVVLSIEGKISIVPEEKELMLFRISQEAIHNVLKHARAKHLLIGLSYSEYCLNLSISDDGVGFSNEQQISSSGMGMLSMRQRAKLIGGNVQITSVLNKGTTVLVRLPIFQANS